MNWTPSLTLVWDQCTTSFNQKWEMRATQNKPRSLKAPHCLNWAAKRRQWEDPLPSTRARQIFWALAALCPKTQEQWGCAVCLPPQQPPLISSKGCFALLTLLQDHKIILWYSPWSMCALKVFRVSGRSAGRRKNCLATLQPGAHTHVQFCLWATLIIFNGSNYFMNEKIQPGREENTFCETKDSFLVYM